MHLCFFDDQPAATLLDGVYLCATHAICNACLKPLTQEPFTCRCSKYGYTGHDELLWCSQACLETRHTPPDMEDDEEEAAG